MLKKKKLDLGAVNRVMEKVLQTEDERLDSSIGHATGLKNPKLY